MCDTEKTEAQVEEVAENMEATETSEAEAEETAEESED
jgi:hypothetical protein